MWGGGGGRGGGGGGLRTQHPNLYRYIEYFVVTILNDSK